MSQPANHPPQSELLEFGLGKLPPDDSQRIEQHLESCPDCSQTVLVLQDDTFVGLVRTSKGKAPATVNADATLDVAMGTVPRHAAAQLPAELRSHSRYEILGLIGRGGMGDVYQAQHRVMNRLVALKVIKPELVQNEAAVQRFRREVQAAARLHDRNIVTAYDAEQAGSLHFLVMEYVDGVNLDEVVRRRGALPVAEACDAIRQAARGLQHAHELGMVHRDIKPHNLMLTPAGDVKILDFGLAGIASELTAEEVASESESHPPRIANSQLTQAGSMMGTPDYIAPEQATDAHAADIRADIYSLGCTFYTLLAGRPPFDPGSVFDKIKAHAEQTPRTLAEYRADVPAEVEAILLKMLAKNPAERFQTPQQVIAALEQAAPAVLPKALPAAVRQKPSRARLVALATAASFLAILAAIVFYIQTDFGVVRVEVADESLQVKLVGQTIEMKDGTVPLSIRAGEQQLVVRRGDFEFRTDNFELRRGDEVGLKVSFVAGEVVVTKDGQLFDSSPASRSESSATAELSALLGNALLVNSFDQNSPALSNGMVLTPDGRAGWGLDCRGKSLQIPDSLIDGRKQYTIAMWIRDSGKAPDGSPKRSVYRVGEPRDGGTFYPFHLTLEGDRIWASSWQGTKWAQANSAPKVIAPNEWIFLAITVMTQAADRSVVRITVNDQSFLQPFAVLEKSSRKRFDLVGGIDGQIDELVALPQPLTEKQLDLLYRHGKAGQALSQLHKQPIDHATSTAPLPLTIGMNDEFGLLFEGRLVAPAELSRRLVEALKENPDRAVAIDLLKKPWTVAAHVDQLEQIAHIAGAKRITRPAWSDEVRSTDIGALLRGAVLVFNFDKDSFYERDGKTLVRDAGGQGNDAVCKEAAFSADGPTQSSLAIDPKGSLQIPRRLIASGKPFTITARVHRKLPWDQGDPLVFAQRSADAQQELSCGLGIVDGVWMLNFVSAEAHVHHPFGENVEKSRNFARWGKWAFVAWTRDASGKLSYTVDGSTQVTQHIDQGEEETHELVEIGRGLDGGLDELIVFDRALTSAELSAIYRLGNAGQNIRPVAANRPSFVRKYEGHTGAVKSVAFSPDGTLIASASGFPHSDGTIRLWDVKQAKEVRQLKGQQGSTQSLCFSHDGKKLLAGGSDKMLRLWDVATGELLKTLAGHEGSIESVGFSPNDRIAVSGSVAAGGSTDHTARSWDLATGKEIARFTGHKLHVHGVAIIDETRAISVDRMGVGYIWRIDNGQQLKRLAVPSNASNSAYALTLSPDRTKAIIGYQDNAIRIWDVNTGDLIQTLPSQNSPTMSVCMTADQRYLLAGGGAMGDKSVALEVFELASAKRVASTEPMDGTTWSIALSPDGRHVVTAGGAKWKSEEGFVPNDDYALYLWQLPESLAAKDSLSNRILVELKDDGQFQIEGRTVNSQELQSRLQWVLKETPEREVHVLPAKKFSGEPFRNLVSLVRSAGGKRVTWPKEVDEHLLQELTGPELDPAVADAVNDLAAAFEKYLRNIKATSACVGEFPGNLPERIGKPLRTGVEQKLRAAGFEIVPAAPAPKGVFELSGVSYEVQIYKALPKLDVRYRIGRSGVGASQGGSGHITTYGRKGENQNAADK